MKPQTLYRPSDNQSFTLDEGVYKSSPKSRRGHSYDLLIRRGFRDSPFSPKELESNNSLSVECQIDGKDSVITFTQNQLRKLLGYE